MGHWEQNLHEIERQLLLDTEDTEFEGCSQGQIVYT